METRRELAADLGGKVVVKSDDSDLKNGILTVEDGTGGSAKRVSIVLSPLEMKTLASSLNAAADETAA
jgi:hypothetical protein